MDFDKLRESCRKISMPPEMKNRIKTNCETPEIPHSRLDGRLIAVCVCCFFLVLGIGLKYSGVFEKKPQIVSESKSEPSSISNALAVTDNYAFETTNTVTDKTETLSQTQTFTQHTTELISESVTAPYVTNSHSGSVSNAQRVTLYMDSVEDVEKLKNARAAAETMNKKEFDEFLDENEYWDVSGCFDTPEEYLSFVNSGLYIPIAKDDVAEVYWRDYVPYYENIDIGYAFGEKNRIRFDIETTKKTGYYYRDLKEYRYVKTIQKGNVTMEIYELKWFYKINRKSWRGFGIDITVDGQEMNAITTEMTIEELERCLDAIEFMTIDNWLK